MSLAVCPGCERHVKREELACPFCGGELEGPEGASTRITRSTAPSLTRAAAVFAGATAIAACGKEPAPQPPPAPTNEMMAVPAYGAPPPDTLINPPPEPPPPPPAPSASTSAKPIPKPPVQKK